MQHNQRSSVWVDVFGEIGNEIQEKFTAGSNACESKCVEIISNIEQMPVEYWNEISAVNTPSEKFPSPVYILVLKGLQKYFDDDTPTID